MLKKVSKNRPLGRGACGWATCGPGLVEYKRDKGFAV